MQWITVLGVSVARACLDETQVVRLSGFGIWLSRENLAHVYACSEIVRG